MRKHTEIILDVVSVAYGVPVDEILSDRRTKREVHARHMAVWLCRTAIYPQPGVDSIGFQFGRDRSTIINAIRCATTFREIERKQMGELVRSAFLKEGLMNAVEFAHLLTR